VVNISLRDSFDAFFEVAREMLNWAPGTKGDLESERQIQIKQLVNDLERDKSFETVAGEFKKAYGPQADSDWNPYDRSLQNYFRLSGFYSGFFDGVKINADTYLADLCGAFERDQDTITYIIPLGGVSLPSNTLDFGDFQLKQFSKDELGKITKWQGRSDFYSVPTRCFPWIDGLSEFWCLVVNVKERARGTDIMSTHEDNEIPCFLTAPLAARDALPKSVRHALSQLALIDWRPTWTKYDAGTGKVTDSSDRGYGFRPLLTVVLSDCLFHRPVELPHFSNSAYEYGGDDWYDHEFYCNYGNPESGSVKLEHYQLDIYCKPLEEDLKQCPLLYKLMDNLRNSVHVSVDFLDRAIEFLGMGFLDRSYAGFLWNVVVLEALFTPSYGAEDSAITRTIVRQLQDVYANVADRSPKQVKTLVHDLYTLRSSIVHGKAPLDPTPETAEVDNHRRLLAQTRQCARDAVEYAIRFMSHVNEDLEKNDQTHAVFTDDHFRWITNRHRFDINHGGIAEWMNSAAVSPPPVAGHE